MNDPEIKKLMIEECGFEVYENEIFKECLPDFPKYYVSNKGRIFSLKTKRFLKSAVDGKKLEDGSRNGYDFVVLYVNGKQTERYIHRLVAEHFVEKVEGKNYVHHIDADRHYHDASNLCWISPSENIIAGKGVAILVKKTDEENGVVFNSISEAAKTLDIGYHKIYHAMLKSLIINDYEFKRL